MGAIWRLGNGRDGSLLTMGVRGLGVPPPPPPLRPHLPAATLSLSSSSILAFDSLAHHLSAANFRQADHDTRRLLIRLAGEAAEMRGYVFFSEVQFIAADDLRAIDDLWRCHSGGRFGYSVQRRLWEKAQRDFTKFFIEVGWMRRMETEVEQFTYRSFPGEFIWELGDETPAGHLPLTNALRGTQLLGSILTHPAFGEEEEEEEDEERGKVLSSRTLKKPPDYSF
ncbi:tetrapyrrole-binding protein, chloroplastic [Phalaenopsis equestris]|uniref:tetrapyrrole-binding protein, chloroplastic n=1 Tax=Phalaenopsis equestris TaxID=78828 RepID=UPI0009E4D8AD|nr:tetrapyrrole-binding protein, chloroplastic [Phalaenopsis equestris]